MSNTRERRPFTTEFRVRTTPTGGAVIEGHGAVFNRLSRNLGGFVEQVDPSAFRQTLGNNPDVRALINHDPMHILGRTRSGTLRLATDSIGLAYEIDMPDRSDARDLMISMERGDVTQSSFAFFVMADGDSWSETEQGFPLRTLTNLSLNDGDVSPVTYPAYPDADSGVRERAFRALAHSIDVSYELLEQTIAVEGNLLRIVRGELDLEALIEDSKNVEADIELEEERSETGFSKAVTSDPLFRLWQEQRKSLG